MPNKDIKYTIDSQKTALFFHLIYSTEIADVAFTRETLVLLPELKKISFIHTGSDFFALFYRKHHGSKIKFWAADF